MAEEFQKQRVLQCESR